MKVLKYSLFLVVSFSFMEADEFIKNIADAKVGECYKKVYLPAKYETKEEMIEIAKSSKTFLIKEPKFKKIKEKVIVSPAYVDIKDSTAVFKKKKLLLPKNKKVIYFTIGKKREVPMSKDFVKYIKKKNIDIDSLKIGECYVEYAKFPKKSIVKKEYIKKQAYEILDVEPAKFEIIKKKVVVKPEYTKVVKTPAIYETKVIKVLIKPAKKEFISKKDGTVCVVEKPAKYKTIVKKILKTPPLTKVIKFPPTYKEVEVKVLKTPPKVSRRVIPQQKASYDFYEDEGVAEYFWLKEGVKSDAKQTGLKICKKENKVKFVEKEVEIVSKPATTKKISVDPKSIEIVTERLVSDANVSQIDLPAQYEKVKSKILVEPAKIIWKKVKCKKDSKEKTVR